MSCITLIGRHRYFPEDCNDLLPRSSPPFTESKERLLTEQALSHDPWRRAVAAGNPNLPEDCIPLLRQDKHVLVRMTLVRNVRWGLKVAPTMKDDEDPRIRAYVKMVTEND